jgi:glycosyltransferase involved in cell wall biosynthesis
MKICFWGDIAGALRGNTSGGSELQCALLAKALAKSGLEVVIIDTHINEDFITEDGIKVFRIKGWNKGIRFLRMLTHRIPSLYLSLRDQKADIYYCRMRDFLNLLAFWAARKANSKFILAMASDLDALGFKMRLKYFYIPNFRSFWWLFSGIFIEIVHPWLLRNSDVVFVQHEGQKQILLKKRIKSVIVPNLIDLRKQSDINSTIHNDFIYVGALDKRKGFAEFFDLVKKSSMHTFKVIGLPRDKTGFFYYKQLQSFKNVTLLGVLSHSDTLYQIANSKGLISTSPMEGFPNIFLEAWAFGIPVLSLYFDPGGVIKKEELGDVANGNIELLLSSMNTTHYSEMFAVRSKSYINHNHILNEHRILELRNFFHKISSNSQIDCI